MTCPCCRERPVVKDGTCLACRDHLYYCAPPPAGALTMVERVAIVREIDELVAFGRDRMVLMGGHGPVNALAKHLTKLEARRKLFTRMGEHAARRAAPTQDRSDAPLVELVNERGEPILR